MHRQSERSPRAGRFDTKRRDRRVVQYSMATLRSLYTPVQLFHESIETS